LFDNDEKLVSRHRLGDMRLKSGGEHSFFVSAPCVRGHGHSRRLPAAVLERTDLPETRQTGRRRDGSRRTRLGSTNDFFLESTQRQLDRERGPAPDSRAVGAHGPSVQLDQMTDVARPSPRPPWTRVVELSA
jgi:hypothetical protein